MADEPVVAEVTETASVEVPAVEAQGATPEADATVTTPDVAVTEVTTPPEETITRAEANRIAAEQVANLQRSYENKLQSNAHNAKLAEVLEALKDQLAGKKPVDPDALPEGFEVLPEPVQKLILSQGEALKRVEQQQRQMTVSEGKARIDNIVADMKSDPTTGKTFAAVEKAIEDEVRANPHLQRWVWEQPKEALSKLFTAHKAMYEEAEKAKQATTRAVAAVKASSRPAQTMTTPMAVKANVALDGDAAFDQAWALYGEKVLAEQGSE